MKLKALALGLLIFLSTSCTYNISMAHTQGSADDVIDDTQSYKDICPSLTIPAM